MDADSTEDCKPSTSSPRSEIKSSSTSSQSEIKPSTACSSTTMPTMPCQVCTAPSSGYHFGVKSCEACKSFYRRTMKLRLSYTCLSHEAGECSLRQVKGARPPCPACRFSKCVTLGMSLDAAKKGRYSHAKRVETVRATAQYWKDQQEQQPHQQQQQQVEQQVATTTMDDVDNNGARAKIKTEFTDSAQTSECAHNKQMSPPDGVSNCFADSSTAGSQNAGIPFVPTPPTFLEQFPLNDLQEVDAASLADICCHGDEGVNTAGEPAAEGGGGEAALDLTAPQEIAHSDAASTGSSAEADDISRFIVEDVLGQSAELDRFAEVVSDAYDLQNFLPRDLTRTLPLLFHRHLVEEHCKKKKHPRQEPISIEHHHRVLTETGIDLDGRMEIFKSFMKTCEEMAIKTTSFCMRIPGFKSLPKDDRVSIIKQGRLESRLGILYSMHYKEEGICILPSKVILTKEMMTKFYNETIIEKVFDYAKNLQDLYLNEKENGLLYGVLLLNPGHCISEEGKKLCRHLREFLAQALRQSLQRRMAQERLGATLSSAAQIVSDIGVLSVPFNEIAETLSVQGVPGVTGLMMELFKRDTDSSEDFVGTE